VTQADRQQRPQNAVKKRTQRETKLLGNNIDQAQR
jgi:hypothetical protein